MTIDQVALLAIATLDELFAAVKATPLSTPADPTA